MPEKAAYDPCKSPKALNFTKGAGGLCLNKKQYADGDEHVDHIAVV